MTQNMDMNISSDIDTGIGTGANIELTYRKTLELQIDVGKDSIIQFFKDRFAGWRSGWSLWRDAARGLPR